MTQDDIIRMAREARLAEPYHPFNPWGASQEALERFAALVAAEKDKEIQELRNELAVAHKAFDAAATSVARNIDKYYAMEAERDALLSKLQWIADQEQTARDCMNAPGTFAVVLATCAAEAIRARGEK